MTDKILIDSPKDKITLVIFLKTIFTWLLTSLLIIIEFILVIPIAMFLTLIFDMKHKKILFYVTKLFIKIFFLTYITSKFTIILNNIKKPKGPRIYIFNHASQFDTFLIYLMPGDFKVFVKESYTKIPFIGWTILLTGNILVKKMNSDFEESTIIEDGIKKINEGNPLIIFPEGTKSKSGSIGRFKTGGFKIAYDTKAEIVPVVLDTWNSIRPGGGGWIRDDKIWLKVLNTYKYEDYKDIDIKDLAKMIRYQISEELVNIRNTRRIKEKKYYRKHEYYIKLDEEISKKIDNYKQQAVK